MILKLSEIYCRTLRNKKGIQNILKFPINLIPQNANKRYKNHFFLNSNAGEKTVNKLYYAEEVLLCLVVLIIPTNNYLLACYLMFDLF